MKNFLLPAAAALIALNGGGAFADEVSLIAPGGIRDPIQKMIPDFERKTGHRSMRLSVRASVPSSR